MTGCTKISPGCKYCYAERMAIRLQAMGSTNYRNGFEVTLHEHMLEVPLLWKRPRRIFVNSMSDLFHEAVPTEHILRVFDVMKRCSWHQYQVLTKRAERVRMLDPLLPWAENIWMGVSVETAQYAFRMAHLRATGAAIRFLSLEPLLAPMGRLDLSDIDWVIVGGESGPGARPMREEWVLDIESQCHRAGVAFFFKQWGGTSKKRAGRLLQGQTWDQMPRSRARLSV